METLLIHIGRNVRYYRKANGLSQEKLAEKADLDRSYLGSIERGENNISVLSLNKIAHALGVEPFVLLVRRTDIGAFVALSEHMDINKES